MKWLIAATVFLHSALLAHGVSSRVIDDLARLEKLGFRFELGSQAAGGVIPISIRAPMTFDVGDDGGEKPFVRAAYLRPLNKVQEPASLVGAPSERFSLAAEAASEGGRVFRISVLPANTARVYLEFLFARGEGDDPMLVFVPLEALIKN